MKIKVRRCEERGTGNLGWLKTSHTFSFGNYYDPSFDEFGCLRVLNEDYVRPKRGFGTHSHRGFEIFSYLVSGQLEHRDSMGNSEVLKRGDVQFTTSGTGITHSEMNPSHFDRVHFLQIWVKPNNSFLDPSYHTKSFSDSEKMNRLCPIIAPIGQKNSPTIPIHASFFMYACILEPGNSIPHDFVFSKGYLHVIETENQSTIELDQAHLLQPGDGAFIYPGKTTKHLNLSNTSSNPVEFILIDLE